MLDKKSNWFALAQTHQPFECCGQLDLLRGAQINILGQTITDHHGHCALFCTASLENDAGAHSNYKSCSRIVGRSSLV
jgi:hypothetical protein